MPSYESIQISNACLPSTKKIQVEKQYNFLLDVSKCPCSTMTLTGYRLIFKMKEKEYPITLTGNLECVSDQCMTAFSLKHL